MPTPSPDIIPALNLVRKGLVETLNTCFDTIATAPSTFDLLSWVERQRNSITPKMDAIDLTLLAMLQNVPLAILLAARDRGKLLDDLPLYRSSVLLHFNTLATRDLAKWDEQIAGE